MQEPMPQLTDNVKAEIKHALSEMWSGGREMFKDRRFAVYFSFSLAVVISTGVFIFMGYHKEPIGKLWSAFLLSIPLVTFARFMFRPSLSWRLVGLGGVIVCIIFAARYIMQYFNSGG